MHSSKRVKWIIHKKQDSNCKLLDTFPLPNQKENQKQHFQLTSSIEKPETLLKQKYMEQDDVFRPSCSHL